MTGSQRLIPGRDFALDGELPSGTTIVEASAGTGKTYAIVGLATRFLAEGKVRIDELLMVTFTNNSTSELRDRTRRRIADTAAGLANPGPDPDPLVRLLAAADPAEVKVRHDRLVRALADFDAAVIATTLGFCAQMLDGLGLAGNLDPHVRQVDSITELVQEVVEDEYVRRFSGTDPHRPSLAAAHAIGEAALRDPTVALVPAPPPEDVIPTEPALVRSQFAALVRREVARRKVILQIRDYSDLQNGLRDTLLGEGAPAVRDRLRNRFKLVMVDEFQDTDPVQWDILREAFHGHTTLILVGDPKQAIYGFRGAEVRSYLDAVAVADHRFHLTTNFRTDGAVVQVLDETFAGAALGAAEIQVTAVDAATNERRIAFPPTAGELAAPVRLRYTDAQLPGFVSRDGKGPRLADHRIAVAEDVAATIVDLLEAGGTLSVDGGPAVPIAPGHIAVLVRSRVHERLVRAALQARDVPVVTRGAESVFTTSAARDWLWFLQALNAPGSVSAVRLAALGDLFGYSVAELDAGGDDLVSDLSGRLREYAAQLDASGWPAMVERLTRDFRLEERLLGRVDGARELTDLRHVAELMQGRGSPAESNGNPNISNGFGGGGVGGAGLLRWLTDRIDDQDRMGSDRTRRLATDAAAVQLMTVHSSKGLQFPIVLAPFGWDPLSVPVTAPFASHDENGTRVLDVLVPAGRELRAFDPRLAEQNRIDDAAEELRLLYVAVTRAQCQVHLWWASAYRTSSSALQRVLFRPPVAGQIPPERIPVVARDALVEAMSQMGVRTGISVTPVFPAGFGALATGAGEPVQGSAVPAPGNTGPARLPAPGRDNREIELSEFRARIDPWWRRTSYSALVRGAEHQLVEWSEPEGVREDDEHSGAGIDLVAIAPPTDGNSPGTAAVAAAPLVSLLNDFRGSAAFGSVVHEILEHVDPGAFPDLDADDALAAAVRAATEAGSDFHGLDPESLAQALIAALHTPIGLPGAATLAAIPAADRLAEMEFEIRLGRLRLTEIAAIFADEIPADDPLHEYHHRLAGLGDEVLRGYLTGSIDAVLRVGTRADPLFVVVDYKTNSLGDPPFTTAHYTADRMRTAMMASDYILQALLYSVALHRFLVLRLPGYDPDRHLGPVQYHFVRGMVGPETPAGAGVFTWKPPTSLILRISAALEGDQR